jgi:hypothetical protein
MSKSDGNSATAICILGMHRSGTSAVTRIINLLGVDLGRHLMRAAKANPKGFWENARIVACHKDLLLALDSHYDDILPLPEGWEKLEDIEPYFQHLLRLVRKEFRGRRLWGFKDPRTCRLLPLWDRVFQEVGAEPRFLLAVRNPDEVALSLGVRDGISYNQCLLLSIGHNLEAELHTRQRRRVLVTYDQMMSDWQTQTRRIGEALGIEWPRSPEEIARQIAEFIDPELRHHQKGGAATADDAVRLRGADPQLAGWAFDIHEMVTAAAEGRTAMDVAAIDKIAAEFRAEIPRLAAWRTQRRLKERFEKLPVWAARMDRELRRLRHENEQLRRELARMRRNDRVSGGCDLPA